MTIYVGPFTGEIGYEVLYWIPHVLKKFRDRLDEVVAISRGGTDSWYPCKVLNAYDVVSPEDYKNAYLERKRRGEYKQLWRDDPLDELILQRFGINEVALHPSSMYHRLGHSIGVAYPFHPIKKPERYPGLPEKYIAARFYKNDNLFETHISLGETSAPVVALKPKSQIDNHQELPFDAPHVVEYDAKDSLAVITSVVAHAEQFVSTYGGIAYLGPLCGVPTRTLTRKIDPENKHIPAENRLGPLFHKEKISG